MVGNGLKKQESYKSKACQELKKTNHQTLRRLIPEHSKNSFVCCLVALRVQNVICQTSSDTPITFKII
jgi:hypothetical protein